MCRWFDWYCYHRCYPFVIVIAIAVVSVFVCVEKSTQLSHCFSGPVSWYHEHLALILLFFSVLSLLLLLMLLLLLFLSKNLHSYDGISVQASGTSGNTAVRMLLPLTLHSCLHSKNQRFLFKQQQSLRVGYLLGSKWRNIACWVSLKN